MLPVLLRFDGEPEVDKLVRAALSRYDLGFTWHIDENASYGTVLQGNIVYRFPSLQRTASIWSSLYDQESFSEKPWIFRYSEYLAICDLCALTLFLIILPICLMACTGLIVIF